MTQLEEYLEQRRTYTEKRAAFRAVIKDENASKYEKARAQRGYTELSTLIADIDIQIRALDPSALKPKRRVISRGCGGNVIHLDAEAGDENKKTSGLLWQRLGGTWDSYELDPKSPVIMWMNEAVDQLYPRQAEAIDLYYNKGFSLAKCAEIMGLKRTSTVYKALKNGLECIRLWLEIRTLVSKCSLTSPFDWDRFLEEIDVLTSEQIDKLITLLDCKEGELEKPVDFARYLGLTGSSSCTGIQRLKGTLLAFGIPEDEINKVHPIFERYEHPPVKPHLIYKIRINATRAKQKGGAYTWSPGPAAPHIGRNIIERRYPNILGCVKDILDDATHDAPENGHRWTDLSYHDIVDHLKSRYNIKIGVNTAKRLIQELTQSPTEAGESDNRPVRIPRGGAKKVECKRYPNILECVKFILDESACSSPDGEHKWTRLSWQKTADELKSRYNIQISASTAGRLIKKLGYSKQAK